MKNVVWYALAGTRGGISRALILLELKKKPMNANQLSNKLSLDYKTIIHHLRVLEESQLISVVNKGRYGAVFFVSDALLAVWADFVEIWDKLGKK